MYLNYLTKIKYVFLLNGTIQIHKSTSAFEGGSKPDVSTSFIKVVLYALGAHAKRYLMPVLTAFMFKFLARRTINAICLIAMHVCLLKISDEADKWYQIPDEDGSNSVSTEFRILKLAKARLFSLPLAVVHLLTFLLKLWLVELFFVRKVIKNIRQNYQFLK